MTNTVMLNPSPLSCWVQAKHLFFMLRVDSMKHLFSSLFEIPVRLIKHSATTWIKNNPSLDFVVSLRRDGSTRSPCTALHPEPVEGSDESSVERWEGQREGTINNFPWLPPIHHSYYSTLHYSRTLIPWNPAFSNIHLVLCLYLPLLHVARHLPLSIYVFQNIQNQLYISQSVVVF